MKKTFSTLILLSAMYGLTAQTTQPVTTKPVSNSTLSSSASQSNNSNSGVNPNGNPGTIINSTNNSNSTTSGLVQPVTPAPPPAYYTTTDTVPLRKASSATRTVTDTTMIANSGVVPGDSILKEPELTVADAPIIADTQNIVTSGVAPEASIAGQNMALSSQASYGFDEATLIGLSRYAALPQLNTWVPENVVNAMSSRFGNSLYDITMVRAVAGEDKYNYLVRTQENGTFETHTITDVE